MLNSYNFCQTLYSKNTNSTFQPKNAGATPSKPRIELRPAYIDVNEYSPAQVECSAQSSLPVTYQWTRLDGTLSADAYVSNGWLRFNQVRRSDVGSYQCLARNQYGDDTAVLHVYVRESIPETTPAPSRQVSISPPNFSGRPGDQIVLNCRNIINVYATLVWTKTGFETLPTNIDIRDGTLTIQRASVEDTGQYVCTSSSSYPSQSSAPVTQVADVNIYDDGSSGYQPEPPKVKPLDELYTVIQGNDFSVTCEASGDPYPAVTWKKIHEDSLGSNVQQNGNILRIFNAKPDNRGIYQCTATSNDLSTETSAVIDIERK